jgi:uncharacterized protein
MWLTSMLTLTGVSILSKGYWNTYRAQLKNVTIQAPAHIKLEHDLKILHLSDIHIEKLSVTPEKVIKMVKGHTFDLIALTGDYLDRVKSIDRFLIFLKELTRIPNRHGIYAVWGNHDWVIADELPRLKEEMERLGVHVLSNESRKIMHDENPFYVIGIDDHYSGHSNIKQAFEDVPEQGYKVVLTHDPTIVKEPMPTFHYLLCGHFHSGQIHYPLPVHSLKFGIKPFKKYLCGMQDAESTHHSQEEGSQSAQPPGKVYISGGLGQTGANLRLGCRPEVTIHIVSPYMPAPEQSAQSVPGEDSVSQTENVYF